MPFNRRMGEPLEGLPGPCIVVDSAPWKQIGVLTPIKVPDGKFRTREEHRQIYEDALVHAKAAFQKDGALLPIVFDDSAVQVQIYPKEGVVAIIFARHVAGIEKFVWRRYDLHPKVIGWLRSVGLWPQVSVH